MRHTVLKKESAKSIHHHNHQCHYCRYQQLQKKRQLPCDAPFDGIRVKIARIAFVAIRKQEVYGASNPWLLRHRGCIYY